MAVLPASRPVIIKLNEILNNTSQRIWSIYPGFAFPLLSSILSFFSGVARKTFGYQANGFYIKCVDEHGFKRAIPGHAQPISNHLFFDRQLTGLIAHEVRTVGCKGEDRERTLE